MKGYLILILVCLFILPLVISLGLTIKNPSSLLVFDSKKVVFDLNASNKSDFYR